MLTGLCVIIFGTAVSILCYRKLPKESSWIVALIMFLLTTIIGQFTIISSLKIDSSAAQMFDVFRWARQIDYAIYALLIGLCFTVVPRRVCWLPCVLLIFMLFGTDQRLAMQQYPTVAVVAPVQQ